MLEDAAINLLIFAALGWPLARRAVMGKVMAVVILGPSVVAGWTAVRRFSHPVAPEVVRWVLASLGEEEWLAARALSGEGIG